MNIDGCISIDDIAPATIAALSVRIAASATPEQLAYREAEIDELWRRLDMARDPRLGEVMAIHDLLEIPGNADEAARRLRAVAGGVDHFA